MLTTEAKQDYAPAFTYGDNSETSLGYAKDGNPMMSTYDDRPAFPELRAR